MLRAYFRSYHHKCTVVVVEHLLLIYVKESGAIQIQTHYLHGVIKRLEPCMDAVGLLLNSTPIIASDNPLRGRQEFS